MYVFVLPSIILGLAFEVRIAFSLYFWNSSFLVEQAPRL